jgi:hypothetical protein
MVTDRFSSRFSRRLERSLRRLREGHAHSLGGEGSVKSRLVRFALAGVLLLSVLACWSPTASRRGPDRPRRRPAPQACRSRSDRAGADRRRSAAPPVDGDADRSAGGGDDRAISIWTILTTLITSTTPTPGSTTTPPAGPPTGRRRQALRHRLRTGGDLHLVELHRHRLWQCVCRVSATNGECIAATRSGWRSVSTALGGRRVFAGVSCDGVSASAAPDRRRSGRVDRLTESDSIRTGPTPPIASACGVTRRARLFVNGEEVGEFGIRTTATPTAPSPCTRAPPRR